MFDPLNYDPIDDARQRRARQEWRRPADQSTVDATGDSLLHRGLSGLSYVGSVLDKPGRAVRGLLAGKPSHLLATLPFSDSLGITKPEEAVTGAKLNQHLFGLRDNNSWGSWGAGLATELATDPLNLLTLGPKHALTAAGTLARRAGETAGMSRANLVSGFAKTIPELKATGLSTSAELAHATERQGIRAASEGLVNSAAAKGVNIKSGTPLSGIARIGLPFTGEGLVLGTGKTGQTIARGMDRAGEFINNAPGMKTLSSWFDPHVAGATTRTGQDLARKYLTPAREEFERQGRRLEFENTAAVNALRQQMPGVPEPELLRATRMAGEGVTPSAVMPVDPAVQSATQGLGQGIHARGQSLYGEALEHGVAPSNWEDPFVSYQHRMGLAAKDQTPQLQANNGLPTSGGPHAARLRVLEQIPGGTEMLNQLAQNPALAGQARTMAPIDVTKHIFDQFISQANAEGIRLPDVVKQHIENGQVITKTLTHEQQLSQKARALGKYLGRRPEAGEIYDPSIVASEARRQLVHGRNVSSSIAATKGLGLDLAQPMQQGMVPLPDVLKQLKIHTTLEGDKIQGGLVQLHKYMAKHGLPMTEDYLQQLTDPIRTAMAGGLPDEVAKAQGQAMKDLRLELGRFGVTPEQAQHLVADRTPWRTPHELERPLAGWDSFTNAFRKLAYSAWLPSHVRNLASSELQTATQTGPHLQQGLAKRLLAGEANAAELAGLPGVTAGMTDQAAREAAMREAYTHAKVGSPVGFEADIAGAHAGTGSITPPTPGTVPWMPYMGVPNYLAGIGETGKQIWNKARDPFGAGNPIEMAGVGWGVKDFPALEAGHAMGRQTEDMVRLGQYMDLVKKGYAPAEAGKEVLRTQFDYSKLTGGERNVMRKAMPFYTYMRNNLPLQLETAATRPGVTSSQLRTVAGDHSEPLPEHLASGVAIPTGSEHDGNRQYISQLGIPLEEAFERLKIHPGDPLGSVRDTALAYMGGLNPLIKGPLEHLFDTQFFSGRKLSDLRPQGAVGGLGKLIDPESRHPDILNAVAQGLANTPATRFLTMVDKLQDPRKGIVPKALNLLTGVRVSDVDMEKTRAIETRRALEELLKGNPAISQYTNLYVKPEDQAKLTPEEIQQLQVMSRLQANAQRAKREQRLAGQP